MAENQEYEMGNGEFQQDGCEQQCKQQDQQMNGEGRNEETGGGDAPADSGSAKALGRDDDRKLFVGGLNSETTDKELREHFQQYGEIESINVKTNAKTGRSRRFAFIVFSEADSIEKVLSAGDHMINNKKVDSQKAKARHGKILVRGLVPELSDDDIKNFFAQYGTIVQVEILFDKRKNQRKGFCFITFESEQVVQELLKSPKQSINGKEVEVKKATPKSDGMGGMKGARGCRKRRGRGRGDYGGYDYYGSGYGNYEGYGGYDYTGYGGYGNYGSAGGGYSGKQRGGRSQTQRHQPY